MAISKKEIIQRLASKHNLPLKTVTDIVDHQFKFVAKTMEAGRFDSVRLPYFGRFHVNPNRVKRLNERATDTRE